MTTTPDVAMAVERIKQAAHIFLCYGESERDEQKAEDITTVLTRLADLERENTTLSARNKALAELLGEAKKHFTDYLSGLPPEFANGRSGKLLAKIRAALAAEEDRS